MSKIRRTVVLMRGDESRFYGIEAASEDGLMKEVAYWIRRRIEKEGWEADRCFIGQEIDKDKVREMIGAYYERERRQADQQREAEERAAYERLRAKYGDKP